MKKRIALSIDEDIYDGLKFVPRGFSVSDFVGFMLRGMINELKHGFTTRQEFEAWVDSDPELKRIRKAMRDAWGPTVWKATDKVVDTKKKVTGKIKGIRG